MMSYIRRLALTGIAVLLALVSTLLLGNWAFAAAPSISGTTRIILMTSQINQGDNSGVAVSAQLTDNGKPLGNEPVEFDLTANFFGDQQVNLGTMQTDATGTATFTFQPTTDGDYNITAHFRGDSTHPQVEVTRTITYSGPVSPYQPEAVGLTAVRQWITPIVYTGVGIFWLLLLAIAFRTLRGIYSAGKRRRGESKSYEQIADVVYQKTSSEN